MSSACKGFDAALKSRDHAKSPRRKSARWNMAGPYPGLKLKVNAATHAESFRGEHSFMFHLAFFCPPRSAGFQACCIAGFQTCRRFASHAGEQCPRGWSKPSEDPWPRRCLGSSFIYWADMAWLPTVTGHTSPVRGKRAWRRFRNLRYSRLGSLRYGVVPRCALRTPCAN